MITLSSKPISLVALAATTTYLAPFALAQTPKLAPATALPASPPVAPMAKPTGTLDTLVFGTTASETAHKFKATLSEAAPGALGQNMRRALPRVPADISGGEMTFSMRVDPVRRNYFSVKLWGEDVDAGRLLLYIPVGNVDYQVGYRHDGDYLPLSVSSNKPALPGRFYYATTLLPLPMTLGKTSLTLKIVATGRLNSLGTGSEGSGGNYQFNMKGKSRGIYRAYTHTEPMLIPVGEVQGAVPATTLPTGPGEEVLAAQGAFSTAVNARITALLDADLGARNFSPSDVLYLARAYAAPGLVGFKNPKIAPKVTAMIDAFAADAASNPGAAVEAGGDESLGGRFGALGTAIKLLKEPLQAGLSATIQLGSVGGKEVRKQAWADLLFASREFGRTHRHAFASEVLAGDISIYSANQGLAALADPRAFTEVEAQRYGKESVGLLPFSGSDLPDEKPSGKHEMPFGRNFYLVSAKGLAREWGYVGPSSGEMASRALTLFNLTGNTEFRDQAVLMMKARAAFRRPAVEVVGASRVAAMEGVGFISSRGAQESDGDGLAGVVAYGDSAVNGLRVAAATLDPVLVGYAKQMLADKQFFGALVANKRAASSPDAFDVFVDYPKIKTAKSEARLPMSANRPDFAFSDEEAGVIALKHGEERLWIAPYWGAKAGTGINGIGRFHFSTPRYDQIGTLETVPQFRSQGFYVRAASYIDTPSGFQWRPPNPPQQAYGNERLPLGKAPGSSTDSEPFRGQVDFYALRFGPHLIGMNRTANRTFALKVPRDFAEAPDLVSRGKLSGEVEVAPGSSVALILPSPIDIAPIPIAPLAVTLASDDSGATLSWNAASGAKTYTVKRSATFEGPYMPVKAEISDTKFLDTAVSGGGMFFYTVVAVNANGESYESMKVVSFSGTDGSNYPTEVVGLSSFGPRRAATAAANGGATDPPAPDEPLQGDPFVIEGNTEDGVPDVPAPRPSAPPA